MNFQNSTSWFLKGHSWMAQAIIIDIVIPWKDLSKWLCFNASKKNPIIITKSLIMFNFSVKGDLVNYERRIMINKCVFL